MLTSFLNKTWKCLYVSFFPSSTLFTTVTVIIMRYHPCCTVDVWSLFMLGPVEELYQRPLFCKCHWMHLGKTGKTAVSVLHSKVPWLSLVMLNIWLRNKMKSLHPCVFSKIINLLRTCKYKVYTTVNFHVVNFKFTGRVWIQNLHHDMYTCASSGLLQLTIILVGSIPLKMTTSTKRHLGTLQRIWWWVVWRHYFVYSQRLFSIATISPTID